MSTQNKLVADGFCDKCSAESTEKTPGDISTMNGIGRKYYGSAEPCAQCGSVVRTLWWALFYIPIIPLGSYRYKTISSDGFNKSRFWARKSHMRWSQVVMTWIVGIVCAALVIGGCIIYDKMKHGQ